MRCARPASARSRHRDLRRRRAQVGDSGQGPLHPSPPCHAVGVPGGRAVRAGAVGCVRCVGGRRLGTRLRAPRHAGPPLNRRLAGQRRRDDAARRPAGRPGARAGGPWSRRQRTTLLSPGVYVGVWAAFGAVAHAAAWPAGHGLGITPRSSSPDCSLRQRCGSCRRGSGEPCARATSSGRCRHAASRPTQRAPSRHCGTGAGASCPASRSWPRWRRRPRACGSWCCSPCSSPRRSWPRS